MLKGLLAALALVLTLFQVACQGPPGPVGPPGPRGESATAEDLRNRVESLGKQVEELQGKIKSFEQEPKADALAEHLGTSIIYRPPPNVLAWVPQSELVEDISNIKAWVGMPHLLAMSPDKGSAPGSAAPQLGGPSQSNNVYERLTVSPGQAILIIGTDFAPNESIILFAQDMRFDREVQLKTLKANQAGFFSTEVVVPPGPAEIRPVLKGLKAVFYEVMVRRGEGAIRTSNRVYVTIQ